ncbi:protein c12orf60 [Limosa lapponica baueri]|uniref:Protein c12orf60 n=1 Tax=Limosa lapponica baueri TaxID=1758121 RepID=A0A2I0TQZ5_LIMLA|nr:protein c12orf60 [Limosa lapponica baueri]
MSIQESDSTPEMLARLGLKSDKDRLIEACENLHDLVYIYVSSTNTIFRLLQVHHGTNFPIMPVKEHFSIKENLQLVVSALKEMQATVETKDKDLQGSISHSLYAKIADPTTSLQDKIAAVKEVYENYKEVVESITGTLIAVMLKHGNLPDTVESAVHQLLSSPALSLQVSELLVEYADILKILQQYETPSTTEGSSSLSETSQQLRLHSPPSPTSLFVFLQTILQGHRSIKKSQKIAADYLEEAFRVLKPPCEGFQTFVKTVEACILAITDN